MEALVGAPRYFPQDLIQAGFVAMVISVGVHSEHYILIPHESNDYATQRYFLSCTS